MSATELHALLSEKAGTTETVLPAVARPPEAHVESTPYVLEVDRWGARKGQEVAKMWDEAAAPEGGGPAPAPYAPTLAADCHEALFSPEPRPTTKRPDDTARAAWFKDLMNTDGYRQLHQQTCLNSELAGIAAKSLADEWIQYAVANQPDPNGNGPQPGDPNEPIGKVLARAKSTGQALQQAAQDVQTAQDAAYGLGFGGNDGKIDPKALAKHFAQVRNDEFLRDLMAMAGRMRRLAQTLQRTKTQHGRDDTVGVELAGDLARLLPSELAQLESGIPEIELLALDRIARKQAMCRKYRGIERLGKGPIVVVVDESGSMDGEPIITAKSIALALAWIARQQKRWIALVSFSSQHEYRRVAFPPNDTDQDKLIEWLTGFFSGGTHLPLERLMDDWADMRVAGLPQGRTDVIIITDDDCYTTPATVERYRAWAKAEQARTYGIVIAHPVGVLAQICDQHWSIPTLDAGTDAVTQVLSI